MKNLLLAAVSPKLGRAIVMAAIGYRASDKEVVVSFEHGNPDRPLVLGCVYNGAITCLMNCPHIKAAPCFKTLSTPGGGGFNNYV